MSCDDALCFLGRRLPPMFERRVVVVAPGRARLFDEGDWSDALVVVELGAIDLETRDGESRRFARGDVIWLTGLPLSALQNPGPEPAVLVAVRRRRRKMTPPAPGRAWEGTTPDD